MIETRKGLMATFQPITVTKPNNVPNAVQGMTPSDQHEIESDAYKQHLSRFSMTFTFVFENGKEFVSKVFKDWLAHKNAIRWTHPRVHDGATAWRHEQLDLRREI